MKGIKFKTSYPNFYVNNMPSRAPRKTETFLILIGINYIGTKYMLSSCYNNVIGMRNVILSNINIKHKNIFLLTDYSNKAIFPSYINILSIFNRLVHLTKTNPDTDYLVYFHYCGHGSDVINQNDNKQETDAEAEATVKLNGILTGDLRIITDEILNTNFLSRLQSNVKLIVITDSCFKNPIFYSSIVNSTTKAKLCLLTSINDNVDEYDINNSCLLSMSIINSLIKKKDCTFTELADLSDSYLSEHLSQEFILAFTDDDLLNSKFFQN
jgi:hypothetical protein